MARPAKKAPISGEIPEKDFAQAVRIYKGDIKPAQGSVGEFAQEMSTAYKSIKRDCHIQPGAAKAVFKLLGMEDAKRDDYLRCREGLEKELGISIRPDLLDAIKEDAKIERPKPTLVTIPPAPEGDTDLADGAA